MGAQFYGLKNGRPVAIPEPVRSFHLHEANAVALMEALRLPRYGMADLPTARRAIMYARATGRGDRDRLERFAEFVEVAAKNGAEVVSWE